MRAMRSLAIALVLFSVTPTAFAQSFFLKNGDRVVFYGDSITDQRLYTTFVESYVVTRFPKMPVTFFHEGWGGDRVTGGGGGPIDLRLERDVFAFKPTVMTVMLGMNDASYRAFDQGIFDTYAKGYEHIVDSVKSHLPGIRMTLIQPSPFDDVTRQPSFPGGYNAVLVRYGDYVKQLAGSKGASVADLNTYVVQATERAFKADATNAVKLNQDRVHPGPGGQLLMATALLKAWNAPSLVSEVTVGPSGAGKVLNAKVEAVHSDGTALGWTQTDNALPFWLDLGDPIVALALRSSDVVESLDRQIVRVSGLTGNRYTLKIDGEEVGTFDRSQLESGVNLVGLNTPMSRQAMNVHNLTLLHNDIHFRRWRMIQVPRAKESPATVQPLLDSLDTAEAAVVKEQRRLAQPKPHHFELSPAS